MRRALLPIVFAIIAGGVVVIACGDFDADSPATPTTPDAGGDATIDDAPDTGLVIPIEALDSGSGSADATAEKSSYGAVVLGDAPLAYWRMNLSGGVVTNVIAQQPALVAVDAKKASSVDGALPNEPDDKAVLMTGTMLTAALADSYNFTDAPFTLECWGKDSGKSKAVMPMLAKAKVSQFLFATSFDGYSLAFDTNKAPVAIYGSSTFTGSAQVLGAANTPQEWHHYVVVVGAKLQLFVDGVLADTEDFKGKPASKGSIAFAVGGVPGSSAVDTFQGAVDEVAIYDKALDATRIEAHFKASK